MCQMVDGINVNSLFELLCVPNIIVDGGALYISLAASFCFHVPWAGCGQDLMCRTAVWAIKVPAGQGYSLQDLQVGRSAEPIWHERPVRQQEEKGSIIRTGVFGTLPGQPRFA